MQDLALGLGFLAIVEGLVLALMPGRLGDLLETLHRMDPDKLRLLGLFFVAAGVGFVWLARG